MTSTGTKRECVDCGKISSIYSKNRCYWCAVKSYKRVNEKDYSGLVNKLDKVFSEYVRLKDSDKEGFNFCFTSGQRIHWTKLHAGHYKEREHMTTRWNESNVFPQSFHENVVLRGNLDAYKAKLEDIFGIDYVTRLDRLSRQTKVWSEVELKAKIDHYTELVKQLKKSL